MRAAFHRQIGQAGMDRIVSHRSSPGRISHRLRFVAIEWGRARGCATLCPSENRAALLCILWEPSAPHDGVVSGRYRALTKVMTVAGAAPDLNSLTGLPF